jgi:hypothetical protein
MTKLQCILEPYVIIAGDNLQYVIPQNNVF